MQETLSIKLLEELEEKISGLLAGCEKYENDLKEEGLDSAGRMARCYGYALGGINSILITVQTEKNYCEKKLAEDLEGLAEEQGAENE